MATHRRGRVLSARRLVGVSTLASFLLLTEYIRRMHAQGSDLSLFGSHQALASELWRGLVKRVEARAAWSTYRVPHWLALLQALLPASAFGHVETCVATLLHDRVPRLNRFQRELIEVDNGGRVALDWALPEGAEPRADGETGPPDDGPPHWTGTEPIVLVLHGLTGGSTEGYVQSLLTRLRAPDGRRRLRAVVMNARGCGNSPVYSPQLYCGAYTDDLRHTIRHIRARHPDVPLCLVGFSLGANILVNYLGESREESGVTCAVAISCPFDLYACNYALEHRMLNRLIYSRAMAHSLKNKFRAHLTHFGEEIARDIDAVRTVRDVDQALTRRVFGYSTAERYYQDASSGFRLAGVAVPLLCISSLNDPISIQEALPYTEVRFNPRVLLAITSHGGHVGWMSAADGSDSWANGLTADFFEDMVNLHARGKLREAIDALGYTPQEVSTPHANLFIRSLSKAAQDAQQQPKLTRLMSALPTADTVGPARQPSRAKTLALLLFFAALGYRHWLVRRIRARRQRRR